VGGLPVCVTLNPLTNMLYVCNGGSNTVSVIDCTTGIVVATIPMLGNFPSDITVNRLTNRVYVTSAYSPVITEVDGSTNRVTGSIILKNVPEGIASDSSDNLYVIYQNSPNVTVIQGETHLFLQNYTISSKALVKMDRQAITNHLTAIDVDPKNNNVYVANGDDNKIYIVGSGLAIPVGSNPNSIKVDSITGKIYVANLGNSSISIIDNPTGLDHPEGLESIPSVKTIPLNNSVTPAALAVNLNKHIIYVVDYFSGKMYAIDENNKDKIDAVTVSTPSYNLTGAKASHRIGIAYNPYAKMVYVTNQFANRVTVINGETNAISISASLNINPKNSGEISCDEKIVQTNYIFYDVNSTHNCKAIPHGGFSFSSWSDNTLKAKSDNPINFKTSDFGSSVTANFTPTLSLDQYEAIIVAYLAILGPISTILSVRTLFNSRKQKKYIKTYMEKIDRGCNSGGPIKEESLKELESLRLEIRDMLTKGTISDSTYNILRERISECDQKMRK
jgi:YVTN family beta-propeller protein